MNHSHVCGDKSSLVAYLYGECEATERQQIETHLAACAACAKEFDALRAVRGSLGAWTPPEPALGFKIVQEKPTHFLRRVGSAPAWVLAAAAVLVLAAAAAIAHVEVRYDPNGFVVRTGWANGEEGPGLGLAVTTVATSDVLLPSDSAASAPEIAPRQFAAQPGRREGPGDPLVASPTILSEEELLRRVRALIEVSETRQQRELALHVTKVQQEFDAQRQADLLQIEQRIGWLEGMTGAEMARQRELVDYLVRISQR